MEDAPSDGSWPAFWGSRTCPDSPDEIDSQRQQHAGVAARRLSGWFRRRTEAYLNVALKRDRPDARAEVEEPLSANAEPLREILREEQRGQHGAFKQPLNR